MLNNTISSKIWSDDNRFNKPWKGLGASLYEQCNEIKSKIIDEASVETKLIHEIESHTQKSAVIEIQKELNEIKIKNQTNYVPTAITQGNYYLINRY